MGNQLVMAGLYATDSDGWLCESSFCHPKAAYTPFETDGYFWSQHFTQVYYNKGEPPLEDGIFCPEDGPNGSGSACDESDNYAVPGYDGCCPAARVVWDETYTNAIECCDTDITNMDGSCTVE